MNNPYFHKNHPPTAKEKFNTLWKACALPFILFANWVLRLFIKKQPKPIVIGVICPYQEAYDRVVRNIKFINTGLEGFEFIRIGNNNAVRGRSFDLLIHGPFSDEVDPDIVSMAMVHLRPRK